MTMPIKMYDIRVKFIAGPQKGEYLTTRFVTTEPDEDEADYLARWAGHQFLLNIWRDESDVPMRELLADSAQVTLNNEYCYFDGKSDNITKGEGFRTVYGGTNVYAPPIDWRDSAHYPTKVENL